MRALGAAPLVLGVTVLAGLAGCTNEAREVGPSLPQSAPLGEKDPRIPAYQANLYQVSQGGRYFSWYGCAPCHGEDARGAANLADGVWHRGAGFAEVYRAIGQTHPGRSYDRSIPSEQLWQLTAYVRDLPRHYPEKRRRSTLDQQGEPQGSQWSGPL